MPAKKGSLKDIKVITELSNPGDFGICYISGITREDEESISEAERIVSEIKRHVDDKGRVYISEEYNYNCEFCGAYWAEDSKEYNGGCCDKDQELEESKRGNI